MPNILKVNMNRNVWKNLVKEKAAKKHSEDVDKELEHKYSKLQVIRQEGFGCKEYFKTNVVKDARMAFQIRTKMLEFKANYKNINSLKLTSGYVSLVKRRWKHSRMCFNVRSILSSGREKVWKTWRSKFSTSGMFSN